MTWTERVWESGRDPRPRRLWRDRTPTWLSAIVLEWNARLSVNRLRLDARIVLIMESPRCRNTLAEITFIPIRDSILVLTVNWFLSVFGCYCYLPFESFKVVSSKHCSKYSIKLTYKVPIGLYKAETMIYLVPCKLCSCCVTYFLAVR